ncbi:MAG: GNAT family N-acetyltransferase [Candidatus Promineifilaceae bacterium]
MKDSLTMASIINYLRHDPMRHVMHLKMLHHHADKAVLHYAKNETGEGVLIMLPATAFSYDLHVYPDADWIVLLASDSAEISPHLIAHLPKGNLVFKLIHDHDANAIAGKMAIERKRAFLSYTTSHPASYSADPQVLTQSEYDPRLQPLFQMNNYDSAEIKHYLADDAQTFAVFEQDRPLSVGMIFRNFGNVWEVGGLRTQKSAQRRGYSSAVVRTAIAAIGQLQGDLRYQFHEDNHASRRLAESLGLHRFLTVTHFKGERR